MLSTIAFRVAQVTPAAWWSYAVGFSTLPVGVALIACGLRAARGARPFVGIPLAVGVIVTTIGLLAGPEGTTLLETVSIVPVAIAAAVVIAECLAPALRGDASARALAVTFSMVVIYEGARALAVQVLDPDDEFVQITLSPAAATVVLVLTVIVSTISLSLIQADRVLGRRGRGGGTVDGVLSAAGFPTFAGGWLRRSESENAQLGFFLVELVNAPELTVAFGRQAADQARRAVDTVVLETVPLGALIGRQGPRTTSALFLASRSTDPGELARRLEVRVLGTVIDEADRFRAAVRVGASTTGTDGYELDALVAAARADLDSPEHTVVPQALLRREHSNS